MHKIVIWSGWWDSTTNAFDSSYPCITEFVEKYNLKFDRDGSFLKCDISPALYTLLCLTYQPEYKTSPYLRIRVKSGILRLTFVDNTFNYNY